VIDGRVGYTGGMNVGQEYIDGGERFATWRDTHMRYTGQAVAELQKLFARWLEDEHVDLLREGTCRRPMDRATGTLPGGRAGVEDPAAGPPHPHGRHRLGEESVDPVAVLIPDYSVYDVSDQRGPQRVDVRS
jgi:phosphatidylserine/phosphatidylglycerophosphate/cardiolipin synthase-like enzyme